jgi:hypothetical protein
MTEENLAIRKDLQTPITINGEEVWVDPDMVELIQALNNAGLKTRSHCGGHGSGNKFVVIRTDNVTDIDIRNCGEYHEIVLTWTTKEIMPDTFRRKKWIFNEFAI